MAPHPSRPPHHPCASLLIGLLCIGCGPRVAPGPTIEERAAAASTTLVDPEGPDLSLELLTAGSRWDPPGLEGRAHAALSTIDAPPIRVVVGRDRAWVHYDRCEGPSARCASELIERLHAPETLSIASPAGPASLQDLALALIFEGHPYQHPPEGWFDAPAPLREHHLRDVFNTQIGRAMVLGRARTPELAAALDHAVAKLPARPWPDPTIKGPASPTEQRVVLVRRPEPLAQVAIAGAVPRSANDPLTRRAAPLPAATASDCVRRELTARGLLPPGSSSGPRLAHAAVMVLSPPLEPAEVERIVLKLARDWPTLSTSVQERCPDDGAAIEAAWPEGALSVIVTWPASIEEPWTAAVPPPGYDAVYLPPMSR